MKKYIFIIFIIVALVQLFVPAQMIFSKEEVLSTGTIYKFKTEPVDPNDPFRGKYITLRYAIRSCSTKDTVWERRTPIYIALTTDSLGFATVKEVSKTPFDNATDYVVGETYWYDKGTEKVSFDFPFDRFYMNEYKAKPAEDVYRKAQRDTLPNNTYALVAVKDGEAVLKDVIINEKSIADYVEEVIE